MEFILVQNFDNKKSVCAEAYPMLDEIRCVKWDPAGEILASASRDHTVQVIDFKTGKVLQTRTTTDQSNTSICAIIIYHIMKSLGEAMSVCFI